MMKRCLIGFAALALSACGFSPMHSVTSPSGEKAFNDIRVELVEPEKLAYQEAGYYLQQFLYDRLGTDGDVYALKVEPKSVRRLYGITSNDVATRYDYVLSVKYELVDIKSGKTVDKGEVRSMSAFGSSRDPYARTVSEKNAAEQVARDAADRLIIELADFYQDPEAYKRRKKAEEEADEAAQSEADAVETLDQP